jgi:hypothetical protein
VDRGTCSSPVNRTNLKDDLQLRTQNDSLLAGLIENSKVEGRVSHTMDPFSPRLNFPVPNEALDGVLQPPYPVNINLSDLKIQCLTASCRLNPKSVQEEWYYNHRENTVYHKGVLVKALRLVKMSCEIKHADHKPCLWGCKDSNGNPEVFLGTYKTPLHVGQHFLLAHCLLRVFV